MAILKKITSNIYDFDVAFGAPKDGEVKGAKVKVDYIGTIIVPANNVWFPEGPKKDFAKPFKGHNQYKKGVLTIYLGKNSKGEDYKYPVVLANGKNFTMTGDEIAAKMFDLSVEGKSFLNKVTGKPDFKRIDYGMTYSEYDTESKQTVKKVNIYKELQKQLMEALNSNPKDEEFFEAYEEFQKELDEKYTEYVENEVDIESSIDNAINEMSSRNKMGM